MFAILHAVWVHDLPWWKRRKYQVCRYYHTSYRIGGLVTKREAMNHAEVLNKAGGYGPFASYIYESECTNG